MVTCEACGPKRSGGLLTAGALWAAEITRRRTEDGRREGRTDRGRTEFLTAKGHEGARRAENREQRAEDGRSREACEGRRTEL
jgi:hypothetical protein